MTPVSASRILSPLFANAPMIPISDTLEGVTTRAASSGPSIRLARQANWKRDSSGIGW